MTLQFMWSPWQPKAAAMQSSQMQVSTAMIYETVLEEVSMPT